MNSLICYNFRAKQALSVTFRVGARGGFFSKRPSRYGCQNLSNFGFMLNTELSLINFSEVYNIILVLRLFGRFRPFEGVRNRIWKKERELQVKSFRNFFRRLISSFVMTGSECSFYNSSLIDPLLIRYSFGSYFCSLNREFNKHRNSLYTDNFDLRFRWALTVQLTNTILYR